MAFGLSFMDALSLDALAEAMEEIESAPPRPLETAPLTSSPNGRPEGSVARARRAGSLTSAQYRRWLRDMMEEENVTSKAKFYIHLFATVMPSKSSLLQAAQSRKTTNGSIDAALRFIQTRCEQTVVQCSDEQFPFVHIPTSNPSLAALIWKYRTSPALRTAERMLRIPWVAHLNLDDALQGEHKAHEKTRWNALATFGKVRGPFRESAYLRRAADTYPLLTKSRKVATGCIRKISKAQLQQWLASK